jgi:hypothetical protein
MQKSGKKSYRSVLKEAVQFVPVITLASSFLVSGGVDLERAGTLFVVSGVGAVVITVVLLLMKVLLNPVLVGTNLWLCMGALAFGLPLEGLAGVLAQLQAGGLYTCVLLAGIVFTALLPTGYIGMEHPDPAIVKKMSIMLLILTGTILVWSLIFVENIRLGGGLPFIILNVTRRVMIRRTLHKQS